MGQRYVFIFLFFLFPFISNAGNGTIEFVENKGQWDGPFLFKALTSNSDIYLEPKGFTYVIGAPGNTNAIEAYKHGTFEKPIKLNFHAYKVIFEGAQAAKEITGSKMQSHYYNYYLGAEASRWKTGLHPYHNVDYQSIYKGIDLHIASEEGQLKYDFIIQPGSDPSLIKLKFEGMDGLETKDGNLQITTSVGVVTEQKPYAYQVINGERKEVPCKYKISGNTVSYSFPKGYDDKQLLVIDPTVVFSTFTGSTADNFGYTATYDSQGNFYAGGMAHAPGYPVTTGAFQQTFAGGGSGGNSYAMDIAISKFDAAGVNLLYSTYIGGSDNEQPHSMIVDNNGDLIIAGRTYSNNYPTKNPYDNSYNGGADIIVTKLNATGTALIGSTYIGGTGDEGANISANWTVISSLKHNYGDDARSEVIVDNLGNVLVAASTSSTNFPVVSGAGAKGGQDGVVFKLTPGLNTLLWSTYLGGGDADAAYVLRLDKSQSHIYVAGGTRSNGIATGTVYQNAYQGDIEGFIARFNNGGTFAMDKLTYIGTSAYDQCYGIEIDMDDNVYVMGQTNGNFPVINAAYSNAGANQFVMKLNNDLSSVIFSTVFGSTNASAPNISPVAFLVDTCQNIYISGWGGTEASNGGNTNGMPVQLGTPAPALLTATTDGNDFYFIVLAKNASSLLFGGYFGANDAVSGEHVDGGTSRFDKNGVIYQAICGGCRKGGSSTLPTTAGTWSPTNGSSNCNLVALKIAFNLGAVSAKAQASPDAVLCLGETVQFQNGSANATGYEWDFGDGSGTNTQQNPNHNYTKVGKYKVRMIATNPNACKVRDTAYLNISVDTGEINADFDIHDIQNCPPYQASFTNKSTYSNTPGSSSFTKFTWLFGDNNTFSGFNPPAHVYADSGTYTVRLVMIDTTSCNSPDTVSKTLELSSDSVKAFFDVPPLVCMKQGVSFTNLSKKGKTFIWYFGDGDTTSEASPKHSYDTVGTYTVKLIAFNDASCNGVDSIVRTFTVKAGPTADFVYDPVIPETNIPVTFTNLSLGATGYQWNFGDNTGSSEHTPRPHQYKRTGEYTVCLTAVNKEGCADTLCKRVATDVYPLADIPTGFSPNGDGVNDVLYVVGAGIETMNLKIFNRWGELLFESNSQANGWDGTYKGKQQEMDAYAYTLSITFIDETTLFKKGNITLVR